MPLPALLSFRLALLAALATPGPEPAAPDCRQKAERLATLARMVDWPASCIPQGDAPFVIGTVGADDLNACLLTVLREGHLQGHPVVVRRIAEPPELAICHLVFIGRSESARLDEWLSAIRPEGTLTVGETDDFLTHGGAMALLTGGGRIRLAISAEAARREYLGVSSRLMQLARPRPAAPAP